MNYEGAKARLDAGEILLLDGGTGTELERRGVRMDPGAWCGPASLERTDVLEAVHRDYIAAGAQVITANTYASSRLMLGPAGFGDRLREINERAIEAAHAARRQAGRDDVLVAGSLSHMAPITAGTARPDGGSAPSTVAVRDALEELAAIHRDGGCDLIILEMMYLPERIAIALDAALSTGLPVWAGFSARRAADGTVLSFVPDRDMPFSEPLAVLEGRRVAAAGVMHTPSDLVADAMELVRGVSPGPYLAYPDSGYFKMPNWQFDAVIAPEDFARFGVEWVNGGVQIVGGCCGLSPAHISALARALGREVAGPT